MFNVKYTPKDDGVDFKAFPFQTMYATADGVLDEDAQPPSAPECTIVTGRGGADEEAPHKGEWVDCCVARREQRRGGRRGGRLMLLNMLEQRPYSRHNHLSSLCVWGERKCESDD